MRVNKASKAWNIPSTYMLDMPLYWFVCLFEDISDVVFNLMSSLSVHDLTSEICIGWNFIREKLSLSPFEYASVSAKYDYSEKYIIM